MARLDNLDYEVNGVTTNYEIVPEIAPLFNATTAYAAGDTVIEEGHLYLFNTAHAAGAWIGTDADEITVGEELTSHGADITELKADLTATEDTVNQLDETVNGIHTSVELYDKTKNTTGGCLRADGTKRSTDVYVITDYMPVESGYIYKYTNLFIGHTYAYTCFYDSEKVILSDKSVCLYGQSMSGIYTLNIPSGASFVRFSIDIYETYDSGNKFSFLKTFEQSGLDDDIDNLVLLDNLRGKTAVFLGDSICNGSSAGDGKDGYAGRIGSANDMNWHNYGYNGATITTISGHHSISSDLTAAISAYPDADYIIIEGGTNDADNLGTEGLGTFSADSNYSGSYDTATFSGAFETLLYNAVQNYPHAKIGYVSAQKMGNGENRAMRKTFFQRAQEICVKWGIPFIDLWTFTKLNRDLSVQYDSGMTAQENIEAHHLYTDGQHLTPDGYDVITPCIESWMRTL